MKLLNSTVVKHSKKSQITQKTIQNKDTDATDGIFDEITTLSDEVRREFGDLLKRGDEKKPFLQSLSKIFALLLNTKVGTADKIQKKQLDSPQKQPLKYGQEKTNPKKIEGYVQQSQ